MHFHNHTVSAPILIICLTILSVKLWIFDTTNPAKTTDWNLFMKKLMKRTRSSTSYNVVSGLNPVLSINELKWLMIIWHWHLLHGIELKWFLHVIWFLIKTYVLPPIVKYEIKPGRWKWNCFFPIKSSMKMLTVGNQSKCHVTFCSVRNSD